MADLKYLKSGDAARYLGISPQTLRNWQDSGKLVPDLIYPSGHRKYDIEKLDKFIKEELEVK